MPTCYICVDIGRHKCTPMPYVAAGIWARPCDARVAESMTLRDRDFAIGVKTPLSKRCTSCAFESSLEATYCSQCGAPLETPPSAGSTAQSNDVSGERRHLTVL